MEILVVIGIIALLISILLPSLSKARRKARVVQCLSNLRQMGIAVQCYATENNNILVPCETCNTLNVNTGFSWPVLLLPYLGNKAALNDVWTNDTDYSTRYGSTFTVGIYVCPEDYADRNVRMSSGILSYHMSGETSTYLDASALASDSSLASWPPLRIGGVRNYLNNNTVAIVTDGTDGNGGANYLGANWANYQGVDLEIGIFQSPSTARLPNSTLGPALDSSLIVASNTGGPYNQKSPHERGRNVLWSDGHAAFVPLYTNLEIEFYVPARHISIP